MISQPKFKIGDDVYFICGVGIRGLWIGKGIISEEHEYSYSIDDGDIEFDIQESLCFKTAKERTKYLITITNYSKKANE